MTTAFAGNLAFVFTTLAGSAAVLAAFAKATFAANAADAKDAK
jgi:hypothetical protein